VLEPAQPVSECDNPSWWHAYCNPHSVRPETNSKEEGNDADGDYFQGNTVTEDMGEEETDDIHEDCIDTEEEFELDTC